MARLSIPDEQTYATFTATAQTVFPITFAILSGKADLRVSVDGVERNQNEFTFSGTLLEGGGYSGGTVTLNTAATGSVVIWRDVTPERASQFAPNNSVPVSSIDRALNRAMALVQDVRRDAGRALKVGFGEDPISESDIIEAAQAVASKANTNGLNLAANFRANARIYLNPLDYGAVSGGDDDDTQAWLDALDDGRTYGLPVDGLGLTYGVADFSFDPNVELRNATFKHLAPDTGVDGATASKVVECIGTGKASDDWLRLSNIRVDRNGGSVSTMLRPNQGVRAVDLGFVTLSQVEVFGNNSGEGVKINQVGEARVDLHVHDLKYVHSTQNNDTVEGVVFEDVDVVFGTVRISKLGRTDQTTVERYRYSRGLTLDRCRRGALNIDISKCEQPIDYSGLGSSRVMLTGRVYQVFGLGLKLAHAHFIDHCANLKIDHAGRYGVLVGGPSDGEGTPYQQMIRVSNLTVSNTGSNGYYRGLGALTAGVVLDRNSGDATKGKFPKNIVIENNIIHNETGSVVVTRDGNDLVMADGRLPVSTCMPVIFSTTDQLPNPISPGATYWLIWDETSLKVRIATSYNNAEDGVYVTLTNAGSGTHTMTGKSFMDYRGYAPTQAGFRDASAPNYFRNNLGAGATVADSVGFVLNAGTAAFVPTDGANALATGVWTDITPNGNPPAPGWQAKSDPAALYNTSTGVLTLDQGVWQIDGLVAFVANGTGARDAKVVVDIGAGFADALPFRRIANPSASEVTDVLVSDTLVVTGLTASVKIQARQTSGGALNTHPNTRLGARKISG